MLRKVKAALIGALLGVLASAPQLVEAQLGVNSEREVVEVSKQVVGTESDSASASSETVDVPSLLAAWPYAVMMLMGLYGGWLLWGRRHELEVNDAHQLASAGLIDPDRASVSTLPTGSIFGLGGSSEIVDEDYVPQESVGSLGLSRMSHVPKVVPVDVQSTATQHQQQLDEELETVADQEVSVQSTPDIGSTSVDVEQVLVEVKTELYVDPELNTQQEVIVPGAPDESDMPPHWVWPEPPPAELGVQPLPVHPGFPRIIFLDPNENDLDAFASEEEAKPSINKAKQLAHVRRVG